MVLIGGVACKVDLNMVPEAISKMLEPMLFSGLIVAGTVEIWCAKRSSPFRYCGMICEKCYLQYEESCLVQLHA